ncbi:MAG: Transcription termination factor Rho, partial [Acidimicrobiales bacterium]|nr:Transcription termination factor Rho [Acidimicrobiales bacterium]
MSVGQPALKRSVLERKERDELAAIAEAMGVKAGSRTSKANLIGQILREAGIETTEEKPKRATKPKAGSDNGAAEVSADDVAEKTDNGEAAATGGTEGTGEDEVQTAAAETRQQAEADEDDPAEESAEDRGGQTDPAEERQERQGGGGGGGGGRQNQGGGG